VLGSLVSGPLLQIGRWKSMLLSELLVVVSVGLMLIKTLSWMLVGRFLYGVACGAFSVIGPMYIIEIAPVEISGPAGSLTQLTVTFGILVPFMIGFIFPDSSDLEKDKLLVNIIFMLPLILSAIHIILMITVFKHDTP
jgi:MFS family permease